MANEVTEGLSPIFTLSAAVVECLRDIRDSCHETCDVMCAVRHTAAVLQPEVVLQLGFTGRADHAFKRRNETRLTEIGT